MTLEAVELGLGTACDHVSQFANSVGEIGMIWIDFCAGKRGGHF